MATRQETKTIRECDRLKCRRRKGVTPAKVEISHPDTEGAAYVLQGDLCPYHYTQLVIKNEAMFSGKDESVGN